MRKATVLKELLERLQDGGTHTVASLAHELGVNKALLGLMIEDLVRMGYLAPAAGSCSGQCVRCPLARACAVGSLARIWTLTEKGSKTQTQEHGEAA